MKQDPSVSVQSSSSEGNLDTTPAALPVGAILAVITAVVAILGEVLVGFSLARMHAPPATTNPTITITTLGKLPIVGLGIAWLVSILANAVGLFLQQEDFDKLAPSAEEQKKQSKAPLYPGYVLALIAFAVSAMAGIACILVAGVLLLALLAYYRDLWKKPVLGPVVLAGSKALAVLLGATGGGFTGQLNVVPDLAMACVILAAYTWAAEASSHHLPRRGFPRWYITVVAGVVGLVLAVAAFFSWGMAALNSWMAAWLAIWLTARSASLSQSLKSISGPRSEQVLARQYQRGELLLLACICAARLPDWGGTLPFLAVFLLFPIAALLDRR